jgi:hypothetical protein
MTIAVETIKLQTESYLFENSKEQFRVMPFYELSIEEWVVFEDDCPKYLIDFNNREIPLIQNIWTNLNNGESLEIIVWRLGRFLGREWTTQCKIDGKEVPNSEKIESIELMPLENLSKLFIDLNLL